MDQNNGPEAKISIEETRTLPTTDSGDVPLLLTRISLQGRFLYMGATIRIMEDHMINVQISRSLETMEIDLEIDFSTTRKGTGETMGIFLVLHRLKEGTSHKRIRMAIQQVINLTTLLSADLTTDLRLALHLTNTSSHRAIIRHHLISLASPPLMIPLMNYQIFAR